MKSNIWFTSDLLNLLQTLEETPGEPDGIDVHGPYAYGFRRGWAKAIAAMVTALGGHAQSEDGMPAVDGRARHAGKVLPP